MLHEVSHRIVSHPAVYDFVQKAAGTDRVLAHLAPYLAEVGEQSVLDVGGGTGLIRSALPQQCRYLWMDIDANKLQGYRSRGGERAVLASAMDLCFADRSVDQATCIFVAHHLDDQSLSNALREIARVVRRRLIFVDPLDCPGRPMSKLLWSIDQGSYPRSAEVLKGYLESSYVIERCEVFTVLHRYLMCVARPKARV